MYTFNLWFERLNTLPLICYVNNSFLSEFHLYLLADEFNWKTEKLFNSILVNSLCYHSNSFYLFVLFLWKENFIKKCSGLCSNFCIFISYENEYIIHPLSFSSLKWFFIIMFIINNKILTNNRNLNFILFKSILRNQIFKT